MLFWQVRGLGSDEELASLDYHATKWAHIYLAGPAWFHAYDPERLARSILNVFSRFPLEEENRGHTIDSIVAMTHNPSLANVVVVLEALEEIGMLRGYDNGYRWRLQVEAEKNPPTEEAIQLAGERYVQLGERQKRVELREVLMANAHFGSGFQESPFILNFSTAGFAQPKR